MTVLPEPPDPIVERGHAAGDILEAWNWRLIESSPGLLVVECDLPEALKNPQGQLFGGFTPTYVDFVSIFTAHTFHASVERDERPWMTTINMRCDYFEPILGPTFVVRGESVNRRGRTHLISTTFLVGDTVAAHALATLREMPRQDP